MKLSTFLLALLVVGIPVGAFPDKGPAGIVGIGLFFAIMLATELEGRLDREDKP